MINLIRNNWQDFQVHLVNELNWVPHGKEQVLKGPDKAVRTRWLSLIDSLVWLMPKLSAVRDVIRKYYLKDKKLKWRKNWVRVWKIVNKKEVEVNGSFLLTWGTKFFKPGLKWIEHGMKPIKEGEVEEDADEISQSGFRAQNMPQQVRIWMTDVTDITSNFEVKFQSTITALGGGQSGKDACQQMVEAFGARASEVLKEKFGAWLEAPLCLAEMLEPGKAAFVASSIMEKYEDNRANGIEQNLRDALTSFADNENGDEMEDYEVQMHDGSMLDLQTYLEAKFLCVCIHNADPERYSET